LANIFLITNCIRINPYIARDLGNWFFEHLCGRKSKQKSSAKTRFRILKYCGAAQKSSKLWTYPQLAALRLPSTLILGSF
jgi:hypothetical protein